MRKHIEREDRRGDVRPAAAGEPQYRARADDDGERFRWHIGVIAQDIQAAFERHGIDAFAEHLNFYANTPKYEFFYNANNTNTDG
ncbi:tail fiber domain-containing protein [Paenibacillus sp. GYB004]|uniref:tail fiber domain-containing protein n=1 Tax=Paenibacillus sp. GYB004 TaxID=2994393 RepID=UPI003FA7870E